jgi:IS30 family transposase
MPRGERLSEADLATLRQMRRDQYPTRIIAKRLGLHPKTVARLIRQSERPARPAARTRPT